MTKNDFASATKHSALNLNTRPTETAFEYRDEQGEIARFTRVVPFFMVEQMIETMNEIADSWESSED